MALILMFDTIWAQKSFLEIGTGYSVRSASRTLFVSDNLKYVGGASSGTSKAIYGSYGAGVNFSLELKNMINESVGWSVGFNYLAGRKIKSKDNVSSPFGRGSSVFSTKSNALYFTTSFFKTFESKKTGKPYIEFGFVVGAPKVMTEYKQQTAGSNTASGGSSFKDELTHRFSVGTKLEAGYKINKVYIGLEMIILNPWQKELELVERIVNGNSQDTGDEKIIFEREIDRSGNTSDKQIADKSPFGSIGIRIGYKLNFKKKPTS